MDPALETHLVEEQWLKDLFDHAHDLIQLVQLDGTLLYVNKSWFERLGYRPDEIKGQSLYRFVHPADHQHYYHYRQQIIEGQPNNQPIVFRLLKKNGDQLYVEGVVSLRTKEGKSLYTQGIFRDITARMEAGQQLLKLNEQLRERQHNLHQLLLHAPDAMIVMDEESTITFWNPKAEQVFGWTADEVLHQNLSNIIVPPQYRAAHIQGMKRYLATGVAHVLNRSIEITALNKSGQEFHISLTISQAMQDNKRVFIAFLRDISEQKKNQMELEAKTLQLEQTNKSLEAFAYAASHDLKEPLRKISIFLDRLKQKWLDRLDAEDNNYIDRVENAANRMKALIDDLLSYSVISGSALQLTDVPLAEVMQDVLEDLELSILEKEAQIIVEPLPVVKGQMRQLQQAFQNLLANALKYSKPGVAPRIHIRSGLVRGEELPVFVADPKGWFHLVEVEDNGVGFAQEDAERIFQAFMRLPGDAYLSGTGIGLSIVQKVVSNHHGLIWAKSQPGEGALFQMALPAHDADV